MDKKFLFGVATSSHQNEGNNVHNNWWSWEIQNNLERSGLACNSWIDYKKDIDNVKELGCNSYRFSIEWSRIYPIENKIDEDALNTYDNMIDYCLESGVQPMITLHHFTRPRWFDSKYGGLHNKIMVEYFKKYVKTVCKKFGHKVKWWITFNEPMLECVNGYIRGTRPPGKKFDYENMYKALINILDSHCIAYDVIKKYNQKSMVSIAKNLVYFEKRYYYDVVKSKLEDQVINNFNWGLLDALYKGYFQYGLNIAGIGIKKIKSRNEWIGKLDFLGINHYNIGYIDLNYSIQQPINVLLTIKDSKLMCNSLKWDIYPDSMDKILRSVKERYGQIKIVITESGSCEKRASLKDNKIHKHVMNTHLMDAIYDRHVIGYMWWTLVDNYEWDDGWKPKFGLYRIFERDGIMVREMKDSGIKYKTIISDFFKE